MCVAVAFDLHLKRFYHSETTFEGEDFICLFAKINRAGISYSSNRSDFHYCHELVLNEGDGGTLSDSL